MDACGGVADGGPVKCKKEEEVEDDILYLSFGVPCSEQNNEADMIPINLSECIVGDTCFSIEADTATCPTGSAAAEGTNDTPSSWPAVPKNKMRKIRAGRPQKEKEKEKRKEDIVTEESSIVVPIVEYCCTPPEPADATKDKNTPVNIDKELSPIKGPSFTEQYQMLLQGGIFVKVLEQKETKHEKRKRVYDLSAINYAAGKSGHEESSRESDEEKEDCQIRLAKRCKHDGKVREADHVENSSSLRRLPAVSPPSQSNANNGGLYSLDEQEHNEAAYTRKPTAARHNMGQTSNAVHYYKDPSPCPFTESARSVDCSPTLPRPSPHQTYQHQYPPPRPSTYQTYEYHKPPPPAPYRMQQYNSHIPPTHHQTYQYPPPPAYQDYQYLPWYQYPPLPPHYPVDHYQHPEYYHPVYHHQTTQNPVGQPQQRDCLHELQPSKGENKNKGMWSEKEDAMLEEAIQIHGHNWIEVAKSVGTRTARQCQQHKRYHSKIKGLSIFPGVRKCSDNRWQVQVSFAGRMRYVGIFDSEDKAILACVTFRETLPYGRSLSEEEVEAAVNASKIAARVKAAGKTGG